MMKYGQTIFGIAFLVAVLFLPHNANADAAWKAFQITCSPDLDYFAIHTISLENVEPKDTEVVKGLESQNGIYTAKSILSNPYTCKLPTRSISVEIGDYVAPHYPGECGLDESYSVIMRVNGSEIHKFQAFGQNCNENKTHLVELNHFNGLKDCALSKGYGQQKQSTCEYVIKKIEPVSPQPKTE